jgi:hypothetical protein
MHKLPAHQSARMSYLKHRQDVNRQIILPVVFVVVMVIVLAVLTWVGFQRGSDVGKWASVAIIWMVIPLMALMLVILAASWGVVYLLNRLLQVSPRYTSMAQEYVLWFNTQIVLWVDKIIQPILKAKAWMSLFSREKETEEAPHVQETSNRRP